MVHLAESLRRIAILLQPFLTRTPNEIFEQLGIQDEALKAWESLSRFWIDSSWNEGRKGNQFSLVLKLRKKLHLLKQKCKELHSSCGGKERRRKARRD